MGILAVGRLISRGWIDQRGLVLLKPEAPHHLLELARECRVRGVACEHGPLPCVYEVDRVDHFLARLAVVEPLPNLLRLLPSYLEVVDSGDVLRLRDDLHAGRRPPRRRQLLGRGRDHAGVDRLLAAAVPYLRGTAGDQAGGGALRRRVEAR